MSDDVEAESTAPAEPSPETPRRRSKTKKAVIILLGLVLVLLGGAAGTAYIVSEKVAGQAKRVFKLGDIPESERAPKVASGPGKDALNFLLAGTDARTGSAKTTGAGHDESKQGGKRSDAIMLVHVTADRKQVYLISIPRDSWVSIPGHGKGKINWSYSFGGAPLYLKTVEQLTRVHIDHYMAIDWNGFKNLTDALGGVQMTVDRETTLAGGKKVPAGQHTLTGEQALAYVRDRHNLPNGDFDRIKRQQNFLRSLMKQTLSAGTLTNPVELTEAMSAVTSNLSVDDEFSNNDMRSLAWDMRNIRAGDVTFMTAPLASPRTGMVGSQSVVFLDAKTDKSLFEAVRHDGVGKWIQTHKPETLGNHVR